MNNLKRCSLFLKNVCEADEVAMLRRLHNYATKNKCIITKTFRNEKELLSDRAGCDAILTTEPLHFSFAGVEVISV